jgi:hypothetical protein
MSTKAQNSKRILALVIVLLAIAAVFIYQNYYSGRKTVVLPESAKKTVVVERFDKDLYASRSQLNPATIIALRTQYGSFFKLYVEDLIAVSGVRDPELHLEIQHFLNDPYIDTVYQETLAAFDDLSDIEKELSEAFSYYYYFFPEAQPYKVISFVSGFQYKNALTDSALLLGLDLHLGRQYKYYPQVAYLSNYMLPRLDRQHLVPDAIKVMVEDLLPPYLGETSVLNAMIIAGKTQYALKAILPATADSILFSYTATQMDWANQNELAIWEYLLNENLLYSGDVNTMARLLNDGPFTTGLPQESAPRIAAFAAYKLVNRFMERYPQVSLAELFEMNAQEIVKKAKYKGKS